MKSLQQRLTDVKVSHNARSTTDMSKRKGLIFHPWKRSQKRLYLFLLSLAIIFFVWESVERSGIAQNEMLLYHGQRQSTLRHNNIISENEDRKNNTDAPRLANSTLDFPNIFAISLPLREDRRDELSMIAAASGLTLEIVDGMPSSELSKQSLPDEHGTDFVVLGMQHLACWRSHATVWRMIVERNYSSALIIEDDVDWDLNIRESMSRVIKGLGNITHDHAADSRSPLENKKWDLLYLGTCVEEAFSPEEVLERANETIFVEVPGDEGNLQSHVFNWVEPIFENYFNSTTPRRVIGKSRNPACTHGYAITQQAAQRLLFLTNTWLPFPVDLTMIHYFFNKDMTAYTVFPPLMVQWRNTDDPSRNSDIDGSIELAHNWGFVRSARKHLKDWINLSFAEHYWWKDLPYYE